MNKKGFTLIEIMAVIIMIGLLLLIGVPTVTRNILSSRKSVYKQHEKALETSAKSYMNECMSNNGKDCFLPNAGAVAKMSLGDFIDMGLIRDGLENPEKDPKYCDASESYVIVKNASKQSNSYDLEFEVCLSCSDYKSNFCEHYESIPVCTDCEGPSCGNIVLSNTTWTNKNLTVGVTCVGAEVNCDRETFYEKVSTSGAVHDVTIRDNAGKTATCPVNAYVDKVAPIVEIELKNEGDSSDALDGWIRGITQVEITNLYDELSGINTWGMGTSRKPVYNKDKQFEAKDGISAVYGYAKDNAGNEGRVDAAIEIKRDDQAPTIEGVYFGNQVYPSKPELSSVSSNKININGIIEEYGDIRGVRIYFSSNPSGSQIIVYENNLEQNRGNFGSGALEVTIPLTVKTYKALEVSFSNGMQNNITRMEVLTETQSGFFTNKDVNVYVDAFDALSTVRDFSYNGGTTYQTSDRKLYGANNNNINIVVRDRAGNKTTYPRIAIGNIDKVAPTCSLKQDGTMGVSPWYRSNVTVTIVSRADNLSGVRDYSFNSKGSGNPKSSVQSTDATGASHRGYIQDKAGNVGSCTTNVYRDTVRPTCTLSLSGSMGDNSWYVGNVTVSRSEADERSGVHQRGLSASSTVVYNETKTMVRSTDGTNIKYYGFVKDNAGNEGTCSVTFKRDATPPTCTVNAPVPDGSNGWHISNIAMSLTRNDNLSGVGTVGLKASSADLNGSTSGTQSTETKGITWYGQVKDKAGNITTCTKAVKLDKSKPSCSLSLSGIAGIDNWYRSNITVNLSTEDNISGVPSKGVTTSTTTGYNGNISGTQTSDTSSTWWYAYVRNDAGLTNNCKIETKKDTVKPTCSVSIASGTVGLNSWYISNVGLSLTRNDPLSGINNYGLSTSSGSLNGSSTGTQSADTTGIRWYGAVQDKAGNIGNCSRSVKLDKSGPVVNWSVNKSLQGSNYYATPIVVTASCSDGISGSPTANSSWTLTTGANQSRSKTCTNGAGLTTTNSSSYNVRVYSAVSSCGYASCRNSTCACETRAYCRDASCACERYKSCQSSYCGTTVKSNCINYLGMTSCLKNCPSGHCAVEEWDFPMADGTICKVKKASGVCVVNTYTNKTCRHWICGCELRKSCRGTGCACETYSSCTHSSCGYASCWHY